MIDRDKAVESNVDYVIVYFNFQRYLDRCIFHIIWFKIMIKSI